MHSDKTARYAERVEHHVPVFKEWIQLVKGTPGLQARCDNGSRLSCQTRASCQVQAPTPAPATAVSSSSVPKTDADQDARRDNRSRLPCETQNSAVPSLASKTDAIQDNAVQKNSINNAVNDDVLIDNAVNKDIQKKFCSDFSGKCPEQHFGAPGAADNAAESAAVDDESSEWVEFLSPDHFYTHLPKSSKCDICVKGKHANSPHRRIENQSELRQTIAKELQPKEHLDLVVVDHFILG